MGNYCANLKMIARHKLALEQALEVIKLNLKDRAGAKWNICRKFRREIKF